MGASSKMGASLDLEYSTCQVQYSTPCISSCAVLVRYTILVSVLLSFASIKISASIGYVSSVIVPREPCPTQAQNLQTDFAMHNIIMSL